MPDRRCAVLAAVLGAAVLAGCAPSGLDAQQQRAESRECASLFERHVARRVPVGRIVVDGAVIDLGKDPDGFYSVLADKRGPDDFPLTGGKAATDSRATFVSDLCKQKDAPSASSSGRATTTTTTSTTTTTTTTSTTTTAPPTNGG